MNSDVTLQMSRKPGGQAATPIRGGGTQGMSTRSASQPVAPSRGGGTQGMSTRSAGQPVAPSRGGGTQGMSTRSGGQPVAPSRGGGTQGMFTHSGSQPVAPSRGGGTQGMSTRSGGQPVAPYRGGGTQGMSTRSGSQPVAPSRGGGTQGMSTRSAGQPVAPSRGGGTQGMSTCSGGQTVTPSRGAASEWWGSDDETEFEPWQSPPAHLETGPDCAWVTALPWSHGPPSPQSTAQFDCQQVTPPTGRAAQGASTCYGGQPGTPPMSDMTLTQSTTTCLEDQPTTPTRGEATQAPLSNLEFEPSTSSRSNAAQEFCKGCPWTGKSLRGHLVRTKSPCKDLYNMQELKEQANEVHRKHKGHWEYMNREERLERKRQQYQTNTGASPQKRAIKVSAVPSSEALDTQGGSSNHEPEKKEFKCNICEKIFASKFVLDRHTDEIHDPNPIPCPKCSKSFLRKANLRDHLDSVHAVREPGSLIEMQCPYCDKKFTQMPHWHRHISEVHKKAKPFPCPECPEDFSRAENLRRHIAAGKHTFTVCCEYCKQDIDFKSDTAMRKHFVQDPDHWDRRKKICVESLRWREHDPVYNSYTCEFCQERIPKSDNEHYIMDPSTWSLQKVKTTCVNVLKKRDTITCLQCNEQFKFEDLRKHWPEGTKFNLESTRWQAGSGMAHCINEVRNREYWENRRRRLGTLVHYD